MLILWLDGIFWDHSIIYCRFSTVAVLFFSFSACLLLLNDDDKEKQNKENYKIKQTNGCNENPASDPSNFMDIISIFIKIHNV